jgi:hypothetical protein
MEQVIAVTEQEEVEQEKRFELLRQAAAHNDMTEEEAIALAEGARQWAYEQQQTAASRSAKNRISGDDQRCY